MKRLFRILAISASVVLGITLLLSLNLYRAWTNDQALLTNPPRALEKIKKAYEAQSPINAKFLFMKKFFQTGEYQVGTDMMMTPIQEFSRPAYSKILVNLDLVPIRFTGNELYCGLLNYELDGAPVHLPLSIKFSPNGKNTYFISEHIVGDHVDLQCSQKTAALFRKVQP